MHPLRILIEQSSDWASVEHCRDLFAKVAGVLQDTFGVESGMFVYRKQFLPDDKVSTVQVYKSWGMSYSEAQLTRFIDDGIWFSGDTHVVSETWLSVKEAPPVWKQVWMDAVVQYVGAWKLNVKGSCVGAIVLGRRTKPGQMDADIMAACATHVSLVLDMLISRRIAEHASCHDPLTNVLNRRGFEKELHHVLNRDEGTLVMGILDLNEFKDINDSLGHLEGDLILADVAQTLREKIGQYGTVARFGGDEFVFAVTVDNTNVDAITEYILSWFENRNYTVSVGCSVLGIDGEDWGSCLRMADKRLYMRKSQTGVLE